MSGVSLGVLQRTLAKAADDDTGQPPHARAFAAWMQHKKFDQCPHLRQLAESAAAADGAERQTAHTAVLGYATSMNAAFVAAFSDSVEWLRARQYFVTGRPLIFEIDGLGLLGTAIGLSCLDTAKDSDARAWFKNLVSRTLTSQRSLDWNESLICAAHEILSGNPNSEIIGRVSADLHLALASKGFFPATAEVRSAAWDIISNVHMAGDMTRASAQVAALGFLFREAATLRPGSATVADVASLLLGIARSMRRWAWEDAPRTSKSEMARWNVENEYHVQDLLWVILAPVFPDLDDEEWLKSLGQHHPKADLAIPSLELIIEVKFLRRGTQSALSALIQEVAADASTYLQKGSGFRHLIAFVWDDSATTEQHSELRQGLTRISGVQDAIILPRPAKMLRISSEPIGSSKE